MYFQSRETQNFRQFLRWWCSWTTFFGSLESDGMVFVARRTQCCALFSSLLFLPDSEIQENALYTQSDKCYIKFGTSNTHLRFYAACYFSFTSFRSMELCVPTHTENSLSLFIYCRKKYWNNKKSFGCSLNLNIWFTFDYSVFEHLGVNSALKIFYFNFSLNHTKV